MYNLPKLLIILSAMLCLALPSPSRAATFAVASEAELATALTTAANNGEDNIVNIAAGTYNLTATVTFSTATAGKSLTVQGAGGLAVLDGGSARRVASFAASGGSCSFTFRELVFQNGRQSANGVGLGVNMTGGGNSLTVDHCQFLHNQGLGGTGTGANLQADSVLVTHAIFKDNDNSTSGLAGGMFIGTPVTGFAQVDNCLFVNNAAAGVAGGLQAMSTGHVVLTNNTFVNNSTGASGGGVTLFLSDKSYMPVFYNNVLRGNSSGNAGAEDLYVTITASAPFPDMVLSNNILGYKSVGSIPLDEQDNLDLDPQLDVDYRPTASSPGRDQGYNDAVTSLLWDLDDLPRVQDGVVDIGCYEYALPELALSAASLTPAAKVGQNAASQTFLVKNVNGGTMPFTVTDNVAWLSVSPASGNVDRLGSQTVTVTYNTAGLAPGTYQAVITATDTTPTTGLTKQINVTLTVLVGDLSLSSTSLSPTAGVGQSPANQSFQGQNPGNAALAFTAASNVPWLAVSPAAGNLAAGGSQAFTVTYDTASLAPGTHQGVISVTDTTPDTGLTKQINVTLTVLVGDLSLSSTSLSPTAGVGQSPANQSFQGQNPGNAALAFTAASNVPWLAVSPAAGNLAAGGSQAFTVTYDTASLAPGAHQGVITVTDTTPGSGGAQQVTVTLTVSASNLTGMYRLYNPNTGLHTFTAKAAEYRALLALGWADHSQPMPFYVLLTQAPGSRAVHRLYNPGNGAHFLTLRNGERDILVSMGWRAERDQGYVYATQAAGATEVYGLYNTQLGSHLFTANPTELAWLTTYAPEWQQARSLGWAFRTRPN
ncbi:MAG: hypothetical protein KQJ78_25255 [Deltaproteobacteria bacterium]|nr:hypothetical protein [Deltaproteobacteria bacterium]